MTGGERANRGPSRTLVRPELTRESFKETAIKWHKKMTGRDPTDEDLREMEQILDKGFPRTEST